MPAGPGKAQPKKFLALVATSFPTGLMPLKLKLEEVRSASRDAADEMIGEFPGGRSQTDRSTAIIKVPTIFVAIGR
jgi:hypothetical protein